jgi:hypothetical protein
MALTRAGGAGLLVALMTGCTTVPQETSLVPPREMNVTNDPSRGWGEQQIAINPTNPNNIVIATQGLSMCRDDPRPACKQVPATFDPPVPGLPANFRGNRAIGYFTDPDFTHMDILYSFDRGRSWTRSRVPDHPVGFPELNGHGDPSITVGPDGTFYASWDANDWGTPDRMMPAAGVGTSMSRDGGKTWSPAVLTGTPSDAPKLVVDQQTGTIYGASSSFLGPRSTGNPNLPMNPTMDRWLVTSTDGVHFSEPHGMGGWGAQMTAAHGLLATAFNTTATASPFSPANNNLCGDKPSPCTIFQTTADGGRSWSRHVLPNRLPATAGGLVAPGNAPMVAADPTARGRFSVGVAMNNEGEYHIYTTSDSGRSWSGPVVLTDDAAKGHYFGVMRYSASGLLGVAWHTRLGGPAPGLFPPPAPYNIWAAISRDGGKTFTKPVKASTVDSPAGSSTGDDYSGIALDRDYLYTTWADWRTGTRENFMAAIPLSDFK